MSLPHIDNQLASTVTATSAAIGGNIDAARALVANPGTVALMRRAGNANEAKRLRSIKAAALKVKAATADFVNLMHWVPERAEREERSRIFDALRSAVDEVIEIDLATLAQIEQAEGEGALCKS